MKKTTIIVLVILGVLALWGFSSYNGLITSQNLYGNHAADKLATQGAKLVVPDNLTIAAHHTKFNITATQQIRIFNILTRRWNLCKTMGLQTAY